MLCCLSERIWSSEGSEWGGEWKVNKMAKEGRSGKANTKIRLSSRENLWKSPVKRWKKKGWEREVAKTEFDLASKEGRTKDGVYIPDRSRRTVNDLHTFHKLHREA